MTETCNLLIGIGRKYLDPGSIFQVPKGPFTRSSKMSNYAAFSFFEREADLRPYF
jgi:hypothetical protein